MIYPYRGVVCEGRRCVRLDVETHRHEQMLDLTGSVRQAVAEAGVRSGDVLVYCPHTTAAVTVNEAADPDVQRDILAGLARLVPERADWRHVEGNADAHVKASIVGSSVLVPIEDGKPLLGTWQGVFFCEFDGPRRRSVIITVRSA